MKDFFRKDLKLNSKWWHRLVKVIWILTFLIVLLFCYEGYEPDFEGTIENKGTLVDRIKDNKTYRAFSLLDYEKEGWYPVEDYKEGYYYMTYYESKDRLIKMKTDLFGLDLYCSKTWDNYKIAELKEQFKWNSVSDGYYGEGMYFGENTNKGIADSIIDPCVGISDKGVLKINESFISDDRAWFATGGYAFEITDPNKALLIFIRIVEIILTTVVYAGITMLIYYKGIIYIIYGNKKH